MLMHCRFSDKQFTVSTGQHLIKCSKKSTFKYKTIGLDSWPWVQFSGTLQFVQPACGHTENLKFTKIISLHFVWHFDVFAYQTRSRNSDWTNPVKVHKAQPISQNLNTIRTHSNSVLQDDVMSWGDSSLIYFLGDQEEVKHSFSGDGVIQNCSRWNIFVFSSSGTSGPKLGLDPLGHNNKCDLWLIICESFQGILHHSKFIIFGEFQTSISYTIPINNDLFWKLVIDFLILLKGI